VKTVHARSGGEWKSWLQRNHLLEREVWLVFYKKGAKRSGISYDEALDWALCFGWIDSLIRRIDDLEYARKFTPRRPGSIWSRSNLDRVERLTKEGKMTEHGLKPFRQRTGEPSFAERFKAEDRPYPPGFLSAIKKNKRAWENFQRFTPGYKKRYLMWVTSASTSAARDRRIEEAVGLIARNVKSLMK